MEKCQKRWRSLIWALAVITVFPLSITAPTLAQDILPGIDEGSITYQSEPFTIDRNKLFDSIGNSNELKSIIEEETGLELPAPLQGSYFGGEKDKLDICRIICFVEDGVETCYNTCGLDVVK